MIGPCLIAALISTAAPGPGSVPSAGPGPGQLLVTGAAVLAPQGDRWLEGQAVLIAGSRILRIGTPGRMEADAGAARLDLRGGYLVPGLIDLHTHLLLHPYNEASWDDQVLKESLGLRTARAVAAARTV